MPGIGTIRGFLDPVPLDYYTTFDFRGGSHLLDVIAHGTGIRPAARTVHPLGLSDHAVLEMDFDLA